jgi:hypothetical protein
MHPDFLKAKLGDWDAKSINLRSRLSHRVRRQQRNDNGWIDIPIRHHESLHIEGTTPTPSEQLDDLIMLAGQNQPSAGDHAVLRGEFVGAWIGTAVSQWSFEESLLWLLQQPRTATFIECRIENPNVHLKLKFEGWDRYSALLHSRVESRVVLMAMQFGDTELTRMVDDCFKPAVLRAGFELRTIAENQPAGLIDDQLRVALRRSRFVIADLTHRNNGAYWEAGFAEGLGRPVIYTCRDGEWQKKASHFDTNHLVTVIWNPDNLASAGSRLTATIRATLPAEANMADE